MENKYVRRCEGMPEFGSAGGVTPPINKSPDPNEVFSKADCSFRAKNGSAVLVAGGSLIPLSAEPLDIGIPLLQHNSNLILRISFATDPEKKESRWEVNADLSSPLLIGLKFFNLNVPFGGGPTNPIKLWRNASLLISGVFRFYTSESGPPLIHFSFYQSPAEEVKS